MNETISEPGRIRDLPKILPRETDIDDNSYLAEAWARGPVVRDNMGFVHSFPYENFLMLLDDRYTRQVETEGIRARGIASGPIFDFFANSLLTSNGDVHRARRTPLARSFSFPLMKALRPLVADAAEALIAPLADRAEVDVLNEVAGPMPAQIIAGVLGVPKADVPKFTALVYSAIRALGSRSESVMREAEADMGRLTEYVAGLLAERRKNPKNDFLSDYLASVQDGPLSEDEIRITVVSLILAGSDTTRAAMTITFARLLEHPDQWDLLRSDPDHWKGPTVEEGLRFDPVVGALARIAVTDFELSGTKILDGTFIMPSLLTAMRDPQVYDNPEQFDISRTDHPRYSPAFGGGVHRCLGEALARIELEEAVSAFARYWPAAQLVGPMPRLRGLTGTRGIDGLRVAPNSG